MNNELLHRSPNRLPALFRHVVRHEDLAQLWVPGAVNLDAGGGPWEQATEFLAARGVRNVVWDPYARTPEQNAAALAQLAETPPDTATLSNVLNVIPNLRERLALLAWVREWLPGGGWLFVTVWQARGVGQRPGGTWQAGCPLKCFRGEMERSYARTERRGPLLIARRGRRGGSADALDSSLPMLSAAEGGV